MNIAKLPSVPRQILKDIPPKPYRSMLPALLLCRHARRLAVVRFGYRHCDGYILDYSHRWYEDYPVSPRG